MNANEIVKALRDMLPPQVDYAELVCAEGFAHGQHYVWEDPEPYIINDAADLIESLQAENTQLKDELAEYNCDTKIGCKLIEEVKAERDGQQPTKMFRAGITDGIHLDRLEEICNAEREGRCVVLPFPIGTKVYIVVRHGVLHDKILENVVCGYSENEWQGSINKGKDSRFVICHNSYNMPSAYEMRDVFATRAEAEAALKGAQHE